jgi:hypothetical protein
LTTGPLPLRAAFAFGALFVPGRAGAVRLADRLVWEDTFDGRFEDRAYAMELFERHNEAVRLRVPPERLLVFEVREGWAPLCDFLGVEAPDEPFPRLNETREMRRTLLGLVVLSATAPALAVLTGVAVTVFLLRRVSLKAMKDVMASASNRSIHRLSRSGLRSVLPVGVSFRGYFHKLDSVI